MSGSGWSHGISFLSALAANFVNHACVLLCPIAGGHLNVGEDWSACASREVLEETGLEVWYECLSA